QSPSLGSFERIPNQGPFPYPALPGLRRSYGPLRLLPVSPPKEALPPWQSQQVSRVASPRVCVLAAPHAPASRPTFMRRWSGRPRRPSSSVRRLGARVTPFEACPGFTRVAARTLADPPDRRASVPEAFDGLVTLSIALVATKLY